MNLRCVLRSRPVLATGLLISLGAAGFGIAQAFGGPVGAQNVTPPWGSSPKTSPLTQMWDKALASPRAPKVPISEGAASAAAVDPSRSFSTPEGILSSTQGPFPPGIFTISNVWQGTIGVTQYFVYAGEVGVDAGTSAAPSGTGGVVVYSQPIADLHGGTGITEVGTYTIPGQSALHAISETGSELRLANTSGENFTFSVRSPNFASS